MASYIIAALQGLFSVASLLKKAKKFYVRFTKGIAVITPDQNLLWLRLFVMGFIGCQLMLTQRIWSVNVTVVRSSQDGLMCRLKS